MCKMSASAPRGRLQFKLRVKNFWAEQGSQATGQLMPCHYVTRVISQSHDLVRVSPGWACVGLVGLLATSGTSGHVISCGRFYACNHTPVLT